MLRTSNNRAQQKKMMFLERNLEQLTVVQRQLVEQNSSLKKEVAIAERKLIARNERIQSLESLLQDSQEKLTAANHRYAYNSFDPPESPTYIKIDSRHNSQLSRNALKLPKQDLRAASALLPALELLLPLEAVLAPELLNLCVEEAGLCKTDLCYLSLATYRNRMAKAKATKPSAQVGSLTTVDEQRSTFSLSICK